MNLYTVSSVNDLVSLYTKSGGMIHQLREGVLGCGDLLLYDVTGKLKTYVINEVYLNEWSSAHKVRGYSKTPEKYKKIIDEL